MRAASPIAWAPVEQAVTGAWLGPLKPNVIETLPEAKFINAEGIKNGLILPRPAGGEVQRRALIDRLQTADTQSRSSRRCAPTQARSSSGSHSASLIASVAAAIA